VEGPAGSQAVAGAGLARATGTLGKWTRDARGPGRLENDKATAKMITRLMLYLLLNFLERVLRVFFP